MSNKGLITHDSLSWTRMKVNKRLFICDEFIDAKMKDKVRKLEQLNQKLPNDGKVGEIKKSNQSKIRILKNAIVSKAKNAKDVVIKNARSIAQTMIDHPILTGLAASGVISGIISIIAEIVDLQGQAAYWQERRQEERQRQQEEDEIRRRREERERERNAANARTNGVGNANGIHRSSNTNRGRFGGLDFSEPGTRYKNKYVGMIQTPIGEGNEKWTKPTKPNARFRNLEMDKAYFCDDEEQSFVERNLLKLKNALERKVRILIVRFKALPDSAKVVYILQKILLLLGDARFAYLVFYKYSMVRFWDKIIKSIKTHVFESESKEEMLRDLAQVAFFTTYHKFVSALGDKVINHIVKKHKKQRGDSAMKNKLITHDSMPWTKHVARKRMNNSKSKTDSIKRYIDAKVEREVRRRFYDANIEDIKAKLASAGQKLKQTGSATADKTVQKIKGVLQLIKNNPGKAAAIGAGLAAIAGAAAFGAKQAKDRKEAMLQKVLIDYCNNASKNIRFGLPAQDLPDDKIRQANSALHHSEAENRRLYEQYKNSKHDSFFLDIDMGGLLDKLRKKASAALQSFKEMNAPQKVITAVEAILHATFIMRQLQNEVDDVKWKRTLNSLNNAYQQTQGVYDWLGGFGVSSHAQEMEEATNAENKAINMRLILRPIIAILRTLLLHKGANWLRKKAA